MARRLPETDVVIVGLGWAGSILAKELSDAGLRVAAVERGPWRDAATEFPTTYAQDELRYRIRHDLFLRPAQDTLTFRNKARQNGTADPHLGVVHAACSSCCIPASARRTARRPGRARRGATTPTRPGPP